MMNGMNQFNQIIDEIENNLENEIDINYLSSLARLSVYEFRRIFSFVAGIPLSNYVRNRRMSVAAERLMRDEQTIPELAQNYGYDSVASFSRAFKEFHGFSPKDIRNPGNKLSVFTKIKFDFAAVGGDNLEYSIMEDEAFDICGIKGVSDLDDTECCENVWDKFYNLSSSQMLQAGEKIYASYENGENVVECCIGVRNKGASVIRIPKSKWVSFRMYGWSNDITNEFYNNVIFKWFESVSYERNRDIPNLEVFPNNMNDEAFEWEIRIPIR